MMNFVVEPRSLGLHFRVRPDFHASRTRQASGVRRQASAMQSSAQIVSTAVYRLPSAINLGHWPSPSAIKRRAGCAEDGRLAAIGDWPLTTDDRRPTTGQGLLVRPDSARLARWENQHQQRSRGRTRQDAGVATAAPVAGVLDSCRQAARPT